METKNHIAFIASHPGGLLKDELEARNINQKDFAVEIGMHKTMLNEILKEKRPVTAETALLLEKTLGISAEYWMRYQSKYELDLARIKEKNIQKLINIDIWKIIKEYVPVNYFKKLGYLVNDLTADIAKLKVVYNISSVDELAGLSAKKEFSLFRKSEKLKISKKNVLAWNVVAKYEANNQKVNAFNPEKISDLIQELQTIFFENKKAVNQVASKLKEYGIKFILVPKLEQTPIDGYTFWSGDNPAIALTLRHNRIDNFAFTIMHEIGHIALHLRGDKEQQFFDLSTKNSHLELIEKEADEFAKDSLIPKANWSKINSKADFSDAMILEFSNKYKVNPAIILGRINHENTKYDISTSIDKKLY